MGERMRQDTSTMVGIRMEIMAVRALLDVDPHALRMRLVRSMGGLCVLAVGVHRTCGVRVQPSRYVQYTSVTSRVEIALLSVPSVQNGGRRGRRLEDSEWHESPNFFFQSFTRSRGNRQPFSPCLCLRVTYGPTTTSIGAAGDPHIWMPLLYLILYTSCAPQRSRPLAFRARHRSTLKSSTFAWVPGSPREA